MKAKITRLKFYFDYFIGYFLYNGSTDKWYNQIVKKYQDIYPEEINNLKQIKEANKLY